MRFFVALPGLALALLLVADHREWAWLIGGVLALDIALHLFPWSLPRHVRTGLSYWVETVLYFLPMAIVAVAGLVLGEAWARALPDPLWLLPAAAVGIGFVVVSGIDVRAALSGDLAFLAGPSKASHAAARAASSAVGPFGEEFFFRGAAIGLPTASPVLSVLSAAAFAGRHQLLRGVPRRERRVILVDVLSASSLTLLAVASGSIYPGLLAHLINNLPVTIIQLQQMRAGTV